MSALITRLRQCATQLDALAGTLPPAARTALQNISADIRQGSAIADCLLRASAQSLRTHRHTDIPASEKRQADDRLQSALRLAHAGAQALRKTEPVA